MFMITFINRIETQAYAKLKNLHRQNEYTSTSPNIKHVQLKETKHRNAIILEIGFKITWTLHSKNIAFSHDKINKKHFNCNELPCPPIS